MSIFGKIWKGIKKTVHAVSKVIKAVVTPISKAIGVITKPLVKLLSPILNPILKPIGKILSPIVKPLAPVFMVAGIVGCFLPSPFNIVGMALGELPNIVEAAKNGDGVAQIFKSATTVGLGCAVGALGGALGSSIAGSAKLGSKMTTASETVCSVGTSVAASEGVETSVQNMIGKTKLDKQMEMAQKAQMAQVEQQQTTSTFPNQQASQPKVASVSPGQQEFQPLYTGPSLFFQQAFSTSNNTSPINSFMNTSGYGNTTSNPFGPTQSEVSFPHPGQKMAIPQIRTQRMQNPLVY